MTNDKDKDKDLCVERGIEGKGNTGNGETGMYTNSLENFHVIPPRLHSFCHFLCSTAARILCVVCRFVFLLVASRLVSYLHTALCSLVGCQCLCLVGVLSCWCLVLLVSCRIFDVFIGVLFCWCLVLLMSCLDVFISASRCCSLHLYFSLTLLSRPKYE